MRSKFELEPSGHDSGRVQKMRKFLIALRRLLKLFYLLLRRSYERALDSWTTFNFNVSRLFSKIDTPEGFIDFSSPPKLARLFPLNRVKPSLDR